MTDNIDEKPDEESSPYATYEKVRMIRPIEGADKIVLVTVLGYHVICAKDLVQVGDQVLFIKIGAFIPQPFQTHSFFSFVRDGVMRTIKLKGVYSQGLILAVDQVRTLLESFETTSETVKAVQGLPDHTLLGIRKYIKPTKILARTNGRKPRPFNPNRQTTVPTLKPFPSWFPKTDQPRLQNNPDLLVQPSDVKEVTVTEKAEGCSSTFYHNEGQTGVCSRNFELVVSDEPDPNLISATIISMDRRYQITQILQEKKMNVAVQGETCGPGLNDNRMELKDHELYIFDIYDIDQQSYWPWSKLKSFCEEMKWPTVRKLDIKPPSTVDEWIMQVNALKYPSGAVCEGVVVRYEGFGPRTGRATFKVISPAFLVKHKC